MSEEQQTPQQVEEQQPPQVDIEKDKSAGQVIIITNPQSDPSDKDIHYTIFVGGIVGYALKGSVPSITASSIFAAILILGTYIEAQYKNHYLLAVTSAFLGGLMGYRAIRAEKFMPAGLVAVISFLMLIRYSYYIVIRHNNNASKRQ